MHQQLRLRVSTGGSTGGSGAMNATPADNDPIVVKRGDLAVVLERIAEAGIDLRVAGGISIEGPGELVLGVEDGDLDALELLLAPYRPRRVACQHADLDDHVGALAKYIRGLTNEGLSINEVYVGAARDGKVPVQVTTVRRSTEDATFG
jgi:hypothetical protein